MWKRVETVGIYGHNRFIALNRTDYTRCSRPYSYSCKNIMEGIGKCNQNLCRRYTVHYKRSYGGSNRRWAFSCQHIIESIDECNYNFCRRYTVYYKRS